MSEYELDDVLDVIAAAEARGYAKAKAEIEAMRASMVAASRSAYDNTKAHQKLMIEFIDVSIQRDTAIAKCSKQSRLIALYRQSARRVAEYVRFKCVPCHYTKLTWVERKCEFCDGGWIDDNTKCDVCIGLGKYSSPCCEEHWSEYASLDEQP